jgi:hypothetical protein
MSSPLDNALQTNLPHGREGAEPVPLAPPAQPGSAEPSPSPVDAADPLGRKLLTADLLEWARRQFTEEQIVAGIREIRATGGLKFDDFLSDLEQAARPNE